MPQKSEWEYTPAKLSNMRLGECDKGTLLKPFFKDTFALWEIDFSCNGDHKRGKMELAFRKNLIDKACSVLS